VLNVTALHRGRLKKEGIAMTKIVLTTLCVAFVSTVAVAEKYPQQSAARADALSTCSASSQARYKGGYDYERNRRADYSACMFQRGFAD
jgi:hypothetical protein